MPAVTTFDAHAFDPGAFDIDLMALLRSIHVTAHTATTWTIEVGDIGLTVSGTGLTYSFLGLPSGGVVCGLALSVAGVEVIGVTDFTLPVSQVLDWAMGGFTFDQLDSVFGGADVFTGAGFADVFQGLGGDDVMHGGGGADTLDGGAGIDYLRGDDGDDSLSGGDGFDDVNGNQGNDTLSGGAGSDWVVGGKGDDSQAGDDGDDLVLGNLGRDTLAGGAGADILRGGQDDDALSGGDGNDWLSGDKGSDTVTGGAGADIFHISADAGLDRVTDFSLAQGDRVQLDFGAHWTTAQVGADTVVTVDGQAQLVLANVQLSSLGTGWIFGA